MHLLQSPLLLTYALRRDLFFVFTPAFGLVEVHFCTHQPLKMLLYVLDPSATGHVCMSGFILLLSSDDTSAVMMVLLQLSWRNRHRCCCDPSGQNRLSRNYLNNIWAQGREEAEEDVPP